MENIELREPAHELPAVRTAVTCKVRRWPSAKRRTGDDGHTWYELPLLADYSPLAQV